MSKLLLRKVCSGFQTGADRAAILTASALGYETAGFMPLGWRAEDGAQPWAEEYGLWQWHTEDYVARTVANVALADATVIFGKRSVGSNRTEESCWLQGRPCLWIKDLDRGLLILQRKPFLKWLTDHEVKTLNVAGNRESVSPGIQELVSEFLMEALPPYTKP